MAVTGITINWQSRVINISRDYLGTPTQTIPSYIYSFDTNQFRLDLKDLEDGIDGMPHLDTHTHNTQVLLGGVIYARIIEMINGYTVTFEDGQYAVNLFESNNNIGDVVNVNQVSIRTNNSAGLIVDPGISELLAYDGYIVYDEVNGFAGTEYPIGTRYKPVNNVADAIIIATKYQLHIGHLHSDVNLDRDIEGFNFNASFLDKVFYTHGFKTQHCTFTNMSLNGDFNDSFILIEKCGILDVSNIYGSIKDCWLLGDITISANQNLNMTDCESGIPGTASPSIDMHQGQPTLLSVRAYSGGLTIENCDHSGDTATIAFIDGGKPHFEPTCSDGYISLRGLGYEDDRSTGTEIDMTAWFNPSNISVTGGTVDVNALAKAVWDEDIINGHTGTTSSGYILNKLRYIEKYVFVDTENLINGDGTASEPFNNIGDTIDFAEDNNIKKIVVYSEITLDRNLKNFTIIGVGAPVINTNMQDLKKTEFNHCTLKGGYTSSIIAQECKLSDGLHLNGFFEKCAISGNLHCEGDSIVLLESCFCLMPGLVCPTISMNGLSGLTQSNLDVRNYSGGLTIKDCNHSGDTSIIEMSQGKLTLDNSCTDGNISIRGIAYFEDNSTGTIVDTLGLLDPSNIVTSGGTGTCDTDEVALAVWNLLTSSGQTDGSFGKVVSTLLVKANEVQHTLNVQTEMLKNKPNNC